jgi:hypothetical protein
LGTIGKCAEARAGIRHGLFSCPGAQPQIQGTHHAISEKPERQSGRALGYASKIYQEIER